LADGTLSVRARNGEDLGTLTVDEFVAHLTGAIARRGRAA
jgi:hypothetical protein